MMRWIDYALGDPLAFLLTAGRAHDLVGADALLAQMADRSADRRQGLRCRRACPRGPGPCRQSHRRPAAGQNRLAGRDFDRDLYKNVHLIEELLLQTRPFRAIATRYNHQEKPSPPSPSPPLGVRSVDDTPMTLYRRTASPWASRKMLITERALGWPEDKVCRPDEALAQFRKAVEQGREFERLNGIDRVDASGAVDPEAAGKIGRYSPVNRRKDGSGTSPLRAGGRRDSDPDAGRSYRPRWPMRT